MSGQQVDLAVVGAGIVGLGAAAAAVERGLRVAVIERADGIAGASVRNFGHIGVGAHAGQVRDYARRSRELWLRLAERAGFWVRPSGAVTVARHADELAVIAESVRAEDSVLSATDIQRLTPVTDAVGGLHLPHDLQVDPREAAPAIATHLADRGVCFLWRTSALGVEPGVVHTSRGDVRAQAIVIAVNADVDQLFPDLAEAHDVQRCGLDMLLADGIGLALPLLTGSSLLRYSAFASAPSAAQVRERYAHESPELLQWDINQMYTERPDGSLIVGDTHRIGAMIPPFQDEEAFAALLRLGADLFGRPLRVRQRWQGVYARGRETFLNETVGDGIRVVSVLTGIGMTTGLGLAESVVADLWR